MENTEQNQTIQGLQQQKQEQIESIKQIQKQTKQIEKEIDLFILKQKLQGVSEGKIGKQVNERFQKTMSQPAINKRSNRIISNMSDSFWLLNSLFKEYNQRTYTKKNVV